MRWFEYLGVWGSVASIIGLGGIVVAMLRAVRALRNRYTWMPQVPLANIDVKHIDEHPMDYLFDIESGIISGNSREPSTMATGKTALIQCITKSVLTIQGKYPIYSNEYGVEEAESIFYVKDSDEFRRQAANLAETLMKSNNGQWIQKLYYVSRRKDVLYIAIKAKGVPETIKCRIPCIHKRQAGGH
jgi:hypothetical protein